MNRRLHPLLIALLASMLAQMGAFAAIWTDRLGEFERVSATPFTLNNTALAEEFGFEAGESAEYQNGNRILKARAYQMVDATGGVAMYQYLQPVGARPAEYEALAIEEDFDLFAVEDDQSVVVNYQNYVMVFEGDRPTWEVVKAFLGYAPKLTSSTRPTLPTYLPAARQIAGSARYILGPESLRMFLPGVPPRIAAFSMGAEAQVASYREGNSSLKLAIFSYPTPQLARKKLEEFETIPGTVSKRESSLIVVCTDVEDGDLAEEVLSQVRYRATITINESVKSEAEELRDLIINIIILVCLLSGLAVLAGASVGGIRFLRRRAAGGDDDSFVKLRIE
jgi:hypothetical protein